MNLVQVDVVDTQTAQAGVDGVPNMFLRGAMFVWSISHWVVHLRGNDRLFAAHAELLKGATGYLFAQSGGVHIGGVEKVDARFDRLLEEWERLLFVKYPIPPFGAAVAHAA
jgi:hypothetical protein